MTTSKWSRRERTCQAGLGWQYDGPCGQACQAGGRVSSRTAGTRQVTHLVVVAEQPVAPMLSSVSVAVGSVGISSAAGDWVSGGVGGGNGHLESVCRGGKGSENMSWW